MNRITDYNANFSSIVSPKKQAFQTFYRNKIRNLDIMCQWSVIDLIAALVDGCSSIKCTFRVLSKWDQSVSDPQICALLWSLWQKLLWGFQPNRKKPQNIFFVEKMFSK